MHYVCVYLQKFCVISTPRNARNSEDHVPVFGADYRDKSDCLYVLLIVI